MKVTGFKYKRAAIEESCAVWEMCKKVQLTKKKANKLNIKRYQGGTVYEKKKERKKERKKYESHENNLESALILQGERKFIHKSDLGLFASDSMC